jgi:hypothetical protein
VHYTPFELSLALFPMLLQAVVVYRMCTKNLHREFPIFVGYTLFHVVSISTTLLTSVGPQMLYFYTYWGFAIADILVSLVLVQEIYRHAFMPFRRMQRVGQVLFQWACVVLCGIAIIAGMSATGSDSRRLMISLLVLTKSADFVIAALLGLLFALTVAAGAKWQRHALGIALGLAVLSLTGAAFTSVRLSMGERGHEIFSMLLQLGYNVACGIWIVSAYSESPVAVLDPKRYNEMAEWNEALEELARR